MAEAIVVARKRAGMKQQELAKRADLSIAHMSRIERAKVDPKISTIKRIAKALGLEPSSLGRLAEDLIATRIKTIGDQEYRVSGPRRSDEEIREEEERFQNFIDL